MASEGEISPDRIRTHRERNVLLRTMGQTELFRPQVHQEEQPLMEGNVFLLCTDGFWGYIEEAEMEMDYINAKTPGKWLRKMEKRLLGKVKRDFDNYTAMAIYFYSKVPKPGFSQKDTPKDTKKKK